MKAFLVDGYGPSITLRAGQVPDPVIGDGDVLVRILASGVNPLDGKIMAGEFKLILPYRTPFVLVTISPGWWCRSGGRCGGSRRATRCTRGPTRTASVPSPS
jgi:hypothetical protein